MFIVAPVFTVKTHTGNYRYCEVSSEILWGDFWAGRDCLSNEVFALICWGTWAVLFCTFHLERDGETIFVPAMWSVNSKENYSSRLKLKDFWGDRIMEFVLTNYKKPCWEKNPKYFISKSFEMDLIFQWLGTFLSAGMIMMFFWKSFCNGL